MRGRGINSGRRPVRPDGTYYRESRRRRVAGERDRRVRAGAGWVALILTVIVAVAVTAWILR
jgi:hypothetical protein